MVLLSVLSGFALLLLGGEALVRGRMAVARRLGLSPLLIGITLVGFGTSMPELVACVEAARQGSPAIAIANVVGSNVFNVLGITGVTAAITPLQAPAELAAVDIWVMAGAIAILAGFGFTRRRLGRTGGLLFLASCGLYLLAVLVYRPSP